MLYTLQIIFYSFIIIFICHHLYLFYVDNFVEKTYHNIAPIVGETNPKKIHIYDDLQNIDNKMNQFNKQDSLHLMEILHGVLKYRKV